MSMKKLTYETHRRRRGRRERSIHRRHIRMRTVAVNLRFGRKASSASFELVCSNDLSSHADGQTLLVTTVLASISSSFVDRTLLLVHASILVVLLHCSLEESFAALARSHAVVLAQGAVTTHCTGKRIPGLLLLLHDRPGDRGRGRRGRSPA